MRPVPGKDIGEKVAMQPAQGIVWTRHRRRIGQTSPWKLVHLEELINLPFPLYGNNPFCYAACPIFFRKTTIHVAYLIDTIRHG